jgi:hypothetical protein
VAFSSENIPQLHLKLRTVVISPDSKYFNAMRLINTQTIELEDFTNKPKSRPDYAILSHTWGPDEVLFADMVNDTARQKTSFTKLQYTCIQAQKEGYGYAWVDTCCIDKSSSAELSEAINSMFEWYRDSKVCYAYLEDVTAEDMINFQFPDDDHLAPDEERDFYQTSFARSRWFTRGWTLQELIGPASVEFYGRDWSYLGSLGELLGAIVLITGIDAAMLSSDASIKSKYLQGFSVAQKMSWAAKRQTTRIEDEAYSLMGIFDVNMPLLYGEGCAAFVRLQEEIIKNSSDQSIFAWMSTSRDDDRLLLAPSPSCFEHARSVVRCSGDSIVEPFAMTNAGLSIRIPLVNIAEHKVACGVLACRYADDIRGPMGLDLRYIGTNSQAVQTFLVLGREQSRFHYKRLPTIDQESTRLAERRPVMLLRRQELQHSLRLWGQGRATFGNALLPTAFFLPEDFTTKYGLVIQVLYPSKHWKKIRWEGYSLLLPGSIGLGAVKFRYRNLSLLAMFGTRERNWSTEGLSAWITICPVEERLNIREVIQKQKSLTDTSSASHASVPLTPFEILKVQIIRNMVMGDATFEIKGKVEKLFCSQSFYPKGCPVGGGIDTVEQPQNVLDAHSSIHSSLFDKVVGHRNRKDLSNQD